MRKDKNILQSDEIDDLSLVVLSCDKYSDLWDPFQYFFERNWKDCPFNKYIVSNHVNANLSGFINIKIGDDKSWSENLINITNLIDSDYIFFILDDLYLNKKVKTSAIIEAFELLKSLNGNYLKLIPQPKPQNNKNKVFGEIKKGSLYRATTVFTIWKKEVLKKLLIPGENPWEFEELGTIRSDRFNGFYSTKKKLISCHHGVVKGKYILSTVKRMKKDGYDTSKIKRQINSYPSELSFLIREIRHKLFYIFIPSKYRRLLKGFFAKL